LSGTYTCADRGPRGDGLLTLSTRDSVGKFLLLGTRIAVNARLHAVNVLAEKTSLAVRARNTVLVILLTEQVVHVLVIAINWL
jgi:hypothetical protein